MVRLGDDHIFPSPRSANEHGVVAYGGDLNPNRITQAYKQGIFPWFESDDNLLWWSPNPRMILYPEKIKISKSLKSVIKKNIFKVTFNKVFQPIDCNHCNFTP